ncbi:isoflavone 4'-O-methyltransferase isoform X2 [Medicago truncatula]|uniref:isoflavone 4'-O-methyltransferase isoform X2 n=1 Tax=Medicago truncatula TaxID=3880 RepID=UPI001966D259|nr:isoflavone 4'-O-methyltransferase isoform X2 [Medicago truncatula]
MDFKSNGSEETQLYHAQIHLYKHVYSFISSMALKSAVELGIVDAIHKHGKPMTVPELASSLKLHPSKVSVLYRFLRLLTHDGFFAKTTVKEETAYALTPPSKLLINGESTCFAPLVKGILHPCSLDMWHSSKKWFSEEKDLALYESAMGETFFNFLNKDSESDKLGLFQGAMAADSQMFKLALKDCSHVFEGLESLVDVAGGTGVVSKLIHEEFPHIKCTVLDQPQVVANLSGTQNLNFVGGDMFKSIPPADAVLLKWVLHDWDDELSLKILKNSKEAISGKGKKGKIIIIDISIDETSEDRELTELQLHFDMVMMTLHNGKEREKKEWKKLIYDAGFSSYKITPICGFKSLIEVYP